MTIHRISRNRTSCDINIQLEMFGNYRRDLNAGAMSNAGGGSCLEASKTKEVRVVFFYRLSGLGQSAAGLDCRSAHVLLLL